MTENSRPVVSGRAIIVQDKKLLLVSGDGNGDFWCTPGGRIEYTESLREGLAREVQEETGLTVAVNDIASVCDFIDEANSIHRIDIFFYCNITSGDLSKDHHDDVGDSVNESKFFTLEEIQILNVVPLSLKTDFWLNKSNSGIYKGMDRK